MKVIKRLPLYESNNFIKFGIVCCVLCVMFSLSASLSVSAESSEGYIIKTNDNLCLLASKKSDVTSLGDNLYKADSIEDAYEIFDKKDIKRIFPDYTLELFDCTYPETTSDAKFYKQWNLSVINAECSREKGVFGRDIKIAVIDSGLKITHNDLNKNNILQGYNCMYGAKDILNVTDNYGHGTAVAGIIAAKIDNELDIAGIADKTKIIPIKVTDGKTLKLSDLYAGVKKAIELKCDIINMSLGGALTNQDAIAEMEEWINQAIENGIIVVAAAGNGGTAINYPAEFENVIGVGGITQEKINSEYSQQNTSVFVTAPGENVLTLSKNDSTEYVSGTSIATPHVSATVALIKELCPNSSVQEIKEILKNTSEDAGDVGYDTKYGNGIINIKNIMNLLRSYLPEILVSYGSFDAKYRIHIHNNADAFYADAYFANYSNNVLSGIKVIKNIEFNNGVTDLCTDTEYQQFYLWDSHLCPLIKKQLIEY